MIPDCDGRSDGQTVRRSDGQTESIIANTALCIARAMLTRCKKKEKEKRKRKKQHLLVIGRCAFHKNCIVNRQIRLDWIE